jgi:hypothetical protein
MSVIINGSAGVTTNSGAVYDSLQRGTVNAGGTNPFPISAGPATVDFTSIPPWVKRITIMFSGVSVSSTSYLLVQIGSGSVDATNYVSYASRSGNSGTTAGQTSTAGFIADTGGSGGNLWYGTMTLTNISANVWVESHTLGINAGANFAGSGGGTKTLSGTLDRVRITTVSGTDLFDLGSINILYE